MLYAFALPMALVDQFGWMTILVTLVVSYVFFGIEEIGVEIEDPFGSDDNDLPLESFVETIEGDIQQLDAAAAMSVASGFGEPGLRPVSLQGDDPFGLRREANAE